MPPYNKNSEANQSLSLGFGYSYISSIRQGNNDWYCYIMALREDDNELFKDGYKRYLTKRAEVVDEFLELYSELEERRFVTKFDKDYERTPFSTSKWGIRAVSKTITFKGFRYLELLIPKMDEFIEKNMRIIRL